MPQLRPVSMAPETVRPKRRRLSVSEMRTRPSRVWRSISGATRRTPAADLAGARNLHPDRLADCDFAEAHLRDVGLDLDLAATGDAEQRLRGGRRRDRADAGAPANDHPLRRGRDLAGLTPACAGSRQPRKRLVGADKVALLDEDLGNAPPFRFREDQDLLPRNQRAGEEDQIGEARVGGAGERHGRSRGIGRLRVGGARRCEGKQSRGAQAAGEPHPQAALPPRRSVDHPRSPSVRSCRHKAAAPVWKPLRHGSTGSRAGAAAFLEPNASHTSRSLSAFVSRARALRSCQPRARMRSNRAR